MSHVAVVGNLARDRVDGGPPQPGGCPFFAAYALRAIGGPKSMISDLGGPFAIVSSTKKIVVSMNGNLEEELATPESFVGIWSLDASRGAAA